MRIEGVWNRLVVIGCGKAKGKTRCEAQDLYTGGLFKARRAYAEASGAPWLIASAQYGIMRADREIEPYDLTMKQLCAPDQAAWALTIALDLVSGLPDETPMREICIELHMGADYAEMLRDTLIAVGFTVDWVTRGLGMGEQLAWYKRPHLGGAR